MNVTSFSLPRGFRRQVGTSVKYGICRDAKIGDLLPPESLGLIQSATIHMDKGRFVEVSVTYTPKENGK